MLTSYQLSIFSVILNLKNMENMQLNIQCITQRTEVPHLQYHWAVINDI